MFQQIISTKEQAVVHLFFHCCLKDGELGEEELRTVSDIIVSIGIQEHLNLKEEAAAYTYYYKNIRDESAYLSFLIELIHPKQPLALLSFCAELFLSDNNMTLSEEVLINKIASHLYIKPAENKTVQDLICQLNEVNKTKAF